MTMRKCDVRALAEIMDELRPPDPELSQPKIAWREARNKMRNRLIPVGYLFDFDQRCPERNERL